MLGHVPTIPLLGLGSSFLLSLLGLLLDGEPRRAWLAHPLQAAGALTLLAAGVLHWRSGASAGYVLSHAGIGLALLGVLLEMRLPFALLRPAVAIHAAGDVLFLAGFALSLAYRVHAPPVVGWVFIAIAGLVSVYAAVVNLVVQISRLRDPRSGWRYRVLDVSAAGLKLKTLDGDVTLPWRHVEAVKPLDGRHLLLVLPAPLPQELRSAGLPVEDLRQSSEAPAGPDTPGPDRYALILHEQELGKAIPEASAAVARFVGQSSNP